MKKEYENAELEVVLLGVQDIITSSSTPNSGGADSSDTDWSGGQEIIW